PPESSIGSCPENAGPIKSRHHEHPHEGEPNMCRPATCRTCKKTTWAGCGQHVAQVKASVPAGQWCPGHPKDERQGGWLSRLFGR
ncbi:MAG: hypothetical protein WEA35_08425, partial [Candidatus Nanopelagicales bacterium]